MSNVWKTLSAIDCSKHVEKKGQLSYLSWAWAWGVMMEYYPAASYEFHAVEREPDGTATVSVTVTVEGQSRYMWLPVMDNKNNAVKNPDARKISDAKMRCLVKCLAMFGLAHYLYAGEDLPEVVSDAKIGEAELLELNTGLDEVNGDKEAFCGLLEVKSLADIKLSQLDKARSMIDAKRRKMEADNAKS
jgi:hypothetical protein